MKKYTRFEGREAQESVMWMCCYWLTLRNEGMIFKCSLCSLRGRGRAEEKCIKIQMQSKLQRINTVLCPLAHLREPSVL